MVRKVPSTKRYVPGTPVHRLKLEIGRQGLTEFDLDIPAQVLAAAGDLWTYATGQWLTHRSPTDDQTRSRWPLSEHGVRSKRPPSVTSRRHRTAPVLTADQLDHQAAARADGVHGLARRTDRDRGHRRHGRNRRASSTNYEVISRTSFADRIEARRSELEHP
jgi:hypothetical protein